MFDMPNLVNPHLTRQEEETSSLGLKELTPQMHSFYKVNPLIYWADFLSTVFLGNIFLYSASKESLLSLEQIIYIILSSFFLFRATVFIHENFHFGNKIRGFSLCYNLFHGFLHKLPSYCYKPHVYHHSVKTYGTIKDPEYDLIIDRPVFTLFIPFFSMAFLPIFSFIRYGITPIILPFISSRGRDWVYSHISTLVMNLKFKRNKPSQKEKSEWWIQDFMCFIYNLAIILLILFGGLPSNILIVWFFVMYIVYLLNFYRVVTSHTYLTRFNKTNFKQQILDSSTVIFMPISFILYPLGLQYHALHHMYPNIPYHNLNKAHKFLCNILPSNHPYFKTFNKGYLSSIKRLIGYKNEANLTNG